MLKSLYRTFDSDTKRECYDLFFKSFEVRSGKAIIEYSELVESLMRTTPKKENYDPKKTLPKRGLTESSMPKLTLGGERGIRTLGDVAASMVFKTIAFDHSAISPREILGNFVILTSASLLNILCALLILIMKKIIFCLICTFFVSTTSQVFAASTTSTQWKSWIELFRSGELFKTEKQKTQAKNKYFRKTYRNRHSQPRRSESIITKRRKIMQPVYKNLLLNASTLKIQATPIKQSRAISSVNKTVIPVFEIGVFAQRNKNDQLAPETIILKKIKFDIIENSGLVDDFSNFQLDVNGQKVAFEDDGNVTVQMKNARIPQDQSLGLEVNINVIDPEQIPHIPGSMRLRVIGAEAYVEQTDEKARIRILGQRMSEQISWDPVPHATEDSSFVGRVSQIFGENLSAGSEAFVLAVNFQAHFDDLLIEELIVTDSLSDNSIGNWTRKLQAVDALTGKVLGETRFLRGKARFRLRPAFFIGRGSQGKIAFKIFLNDKIDVTTQTPRFKLDVLPENVAVRGLGSGRLLSNSNKNFSSQAQDFLVTNSAIEIESSLSQPTPVAITGSAEPVYKFKIKNTGRKEVSLARISMQTNLSGANYIGGISADDFELKLAHEGNEITDIAPFVSSISGSNTVIFDAIDEFTIERNQEQEFILKIALQKITSGTGTLSVSFLGDSTFASGTLSGLRSAGSNFIWSDHSTSLHSVANKDFLSGYRVKGLPGRSFVNRF